MNTTPKPRRPAALGAGVLSALIACLCGAGGQAASISESPERAQKTEIYVIGQYLHTDDLKFEGPSGDVTMSVDDTGLGGFGLGYHFNQFLALRGEFMFGGTSFHGDLPTELGGVIAIDQDAFIQTGRINVDYNILDRRLTPFVTAGLGYQYLETELERLPPVSYCWWDPFWGWLCTTDEPSASDTFFTWNAGVGVRWDISDQLFIKVLGGANWVDYSNTKDIVTQFEAVFSLGWRF
jgi:opacity protein-like surface antigen